MSAKPQYDLASVYLDGYMVCDKHWKKKIKKKIERYNTYGEQPYADETINNIVISELQELLKGE